jgi:hypothetical protein
MFRALSMLIHVNYGVMVSKPNCVLIDDIGEGLDFDRSCKLIHLLREKAHDSSLQLIMSTNDRFVMNNVPLEEWTLLQRRGSNLTVRNYENSKDAFDRFTFMGLSNFDLFALDMVNDKGEWQNAKQESAKQKHAKQKNAKQRNVKQK